MLFLRRPRYEQFVGRRTGPQPQLLFMKSIMRISSVFFFRYEEQLSGHGGTHYALHTINQESLKHKLLLVLPQLQSAEQREHK